jgi:hypothetical protein
MHTLKRSGVNLWEVGYWLSDNESAWVKLFDALEMKDAILLCNVLNGGDTRYAVREEDGIGWVNVVEYLDRFLD